MTYDEGAGVKQYKHPAGCTCETCERMATRAMFGTLVVYALVTAMAVIVSLWLTGGR